MCEDGTYVKTDDTELFCDMCFYTPQSGPETNVTIEDPWEQWHDHRRNATGDDGTELYSGWYGSERIKFVGAWTSPDYTR